MDNDDKKNMKISEVCKDCVVEKCVYKSPYIYNCKKKKTK